MELTPYHSKLSLYKAPTSVHKKHFFAFLSEHEKIYCSVLGRNVFLDKQPDAILKRSDCKYRLEAFPIGIDILKHAENFERWYKAGTSGYSIMGISRDGFHVTVHLREEIDAKKDKKLFLISVFYK